MSTYDSHEPRSNFGLFVFLAFVAAALIGIGSYLFRSSQPAEPAEPAEPATSQAPSPVNPEIKKVSEKVEPRPFDPFNAEPEPEPDPVDTVAPPPPEQILVDAGMGAAELKPEVLLEKIGRSLEESDLVKASMLIGRRALDESQLEGLRKLAAIGDFRLSSMDPVMEIGELEANRKSRWALNFEGEKGARIYFDLLRGKTGGWGVEKMKLFDQEAAGRAIFVDSLGITDAFLRAVLEQNFDDAKSLVDPESVSDAKIAGLCIIFEEAKYRLRTQKPLRAMFNRELTAGFIAHVEDETGEKGR
jgi:hypothetical protein